MAILTASWALDFGVSSILIFFAVYLFYQNKYKYWGKLNIPHTNPRFPFGDIGISYFSVGLYAALTKIYNSFKSEKIVGLWSFFTPFLVVIDLDVVKDILVKDFTSFHDRGIYINEKGDPLQAHNLFVAPGAKWKFLRRKQSPAFTPSKMKTIFSTVVQCSDTLVEILEKFAEKKEIVQIREYAFRFMTDATTSAGFGIEVNSLKDSNDSFKKNGQKSFKVSFLLAVKLMISFHPKLARFLKLQMFDSDITKFFSNEIREIIDHRKENNIKANDFMQLLIELMDDGKVDASHEMEGLKDFNDKFSRKLTLDEVAAQAFAFFLGGIENTSNAVQYALYELALNPDLQEEVRTEIKSVSAKYNEQITFEGIYEMELLGRVIDETLRKYPTSMLARLCNKDFRINGTDIVIPSGTAVLIPIHAIHFDPVHYPNPHLFDPDRFKEENKLMRHQYAYLPFGSGPRGCTGVKFSIMKLRVALAKLLFHYKFEICEKTPIPLVFNPMAATLTPKNDIYLRIREVGKEST